MQDGNLAFVRATYAQWAQGNMMAGVDRFHPDIRFETFMPESEKVVRHGIDGVAAFMREFLDSWDDFRMVGDTFRAVDGATVLVEGFQSAVGKTSGAPVRDTITSVWNFDADGRVTRLAFDREWRDETSSPSEGAGS